VVFAGYGTRISEALSLKVEDIDFRTAVVKCWERVIKNVLFTFLKGVKIA